MYIAYCSWEIFSHLLDNYQATQFDQKMYNYQKFKQLGIFPLGELIKYSQVNFMHDFHHGKLSLYFNETWISNRNCNPELVLRNAENLYVPAHHYVTTKRFLLFTFPRFWNEAVAIKLNPSQHVFLRNVKSAIVKLYYCVMFTNPSLPLPPPPTPYPSPPPHPSSTYLWIIWQIW